MWEQWLRYRWNDRGADTECSYVCAPQGDEHTVSFTVIGVERKPVTVRVLASAQIDQLEDPDPPVKTGDPPRPGLDLEWIETGRNLKSQAGAAQSNTWRSSTSFAKTARVHGGGTHFTQASLHVC